MTLGIVLRRLQRSLPGEAKILAPAFDAAVDEVAATIADLRTIAAGLRPPRLDEGLTAALEDLARARRGAGRARGDGRPRAAGGRGGRLLHRLRGAHQRGQARRALARDGADHADAPARCAWSWPTTGSAAPRPARAAGSRGMADRVAAQGGTPRARQPGRRRHADRGGAAVRVVIAEDTVLLREGLAGLLEDAGHEVVGPRRRRRHAARARRRARAGPRRRRRPHAARLRRRGHARGGGDPPLAPGHRRARPLPAHRDAPRRRAGRRRRRLRLPAQGPRARRGRLPRRRAAGERGRLGARPAGGGHARRGPSRRTRSRSSRRASGRCCR